jgi:hypothetical protein
MNAPGIGLESEQTKALLERMSSSVPNEHALVTAMKSGWDDRVDARRVVHALYFASSCLRRTTEGRPVINQTSTFWSVPSELMVIVTTLLRPVDLFNLMRSCKQSLKFFTSCFLECAEEVSSPLLNALTDTALCTVSECLDFVRELDTALCFANFIRQDRVHRYDTRPQTSACFSAISASHVSGNSKPSLLVRSEAQRDFDSSKTETIFSPSKRISIVTTQWPHHVGVVLNQENSFPTKCIALSILRHQPHKINVQWDKSGVLWAQVKPDNKKKSTVITIR